MSARQPKLRERLRGGLAALQAAVQDAFELAKKTGTSFSVWQDGKIVDLNPPGNTLPKDRPLPVLKETAAQLEAFRREEIAKTKRPVREERKRTRKNGRLVDLNAPKPPKKRRRRKA